MPLRPCLGLPGQPCGALTSRGDSRCPPCASGWHQRRDRARGNRHARGYTAEHDRLRARWKPKVDAGLVNCHATACLAEQRRIQPGMAWDLGHNPQRTAWTGPEHRACNRAAGGKASHAYCA